MNPQTGTQTSVRAVDGVLTALGDVLEEPPLPHHWPGHLHHLPRTMVHHLQRDQALLPLRIEEHWVMLHISSVEESKDQLTQSMDRPISPITDPARQSGHQWIDRTQAPHVAQE